MAAANMVGWATDGAGQQMGDALLKNRVGLSDVRQRFGEAMAGSPEANAFDALAAYVDGGRIDFDEVSRALAGIDTYERFVTSLRERMAEDGLNPVN